MFFILVEWVFYIFLQYQYIHNLLYYCGVFCLCMHYALTYHWVGACFLCYIGLRYVFESRLLLAVIDILPFFFASAPEYIRLSILFGFIKIFHPAIIKEENEQ